MVKKSEWDKFWGTLIIGVGAEIGKTYAARLQQNERDETRRTILRIAEQTAEVVGNNPDKIYDIGIEAQKQIERWNRTRRARK